MITATIAKEYYKTLLTGEKHSFFADEPLTSNGTDTAPSPEELLDAALASCTAITIRMYADRKSWSLENVEVYVEHLKESSNTHFKKRITLKGNLTNEQRLRLLSIAKACPVSKILEGHIEIKSELNL